MTRPAPGRLLDATFGLYREHLGALLAIGAGVSAAVNLILALGLGELTGHYTSTPSARNTLISVVAYAFVTTPLVTAMVACLVRDSSRMGSGGSLRAAVSEGFEVFAPVLAVTVLYGLAVALGMLAFLLPGIYIAVIWYFGALAVVLDGARGPAALTRSAELVRGGWFHAFVTGIIFGLFAGVIGGVCNYLFAALARAADAEVVDVIGTVVSQSIAIPLVAVGATLYYLALRERPQGE